MTPEIFRRTKYRSIMFIDSFLLLVSPFFLMFLFFLCKYFPHSVHSCNVPTLIVIFLLFPFMIVYIQDQCVCFILILAASIALGLNVTALFPFFSTFPPSPFTPPPFYLATFVRRKLDVSTRMDRCIASIRNHNSTDHGVPTGILLFLPIH